MLPRPVPETELYIKAYDLSNKILFVVGSPDALSWLEQEAPLFGDFTPWGNGSPNYWLDVWEIYNFAEVVAYFQSYNDHAEKGES